MYIHTPYEFIGVVNAIALPHLVEEQEGDFLVSANDPDNMVEVYAGANTSLNSVHGLVVGSFNQSFFTFTVPGWAEDWLEFKNRADKWKQDRNPFLSVTIDFINDTNYLQIIGMGPKAIRFILWELIAETINGRFNHWFPALAVLSQGAAPVSEQNRGKVREMAAAWIEWGVQEGHIDRASLVASGLSQSP